jgi:hypothetical protein
MELGVKVLLSKGHNVCLYFLLREMHQKNEILVMKLNSRTQDKANYFQLINLLRKKTFIFFMLLDLRVNCTHYFSVTYKNVQCCWCKSGQNMSLKIVVVNPEVGKTLSQFVLISFAFQTW